MKIPYILLADVETEVSKQFGVWGLKNLWEENLWESIVVRFW